MGDNLGLLTLFQIKFEKIAFAVYKQHFLCRQILSSRLTKLKKCIKIEDFEVLTDKFYAEDNKNQSLPTT